jgi:K+-sensing histidine kinase KdpD
MTGNSLTGNRSIGHSVPGSPLTRYPLRDRIALVAGLVGPFLVALVLVPFRADLSRTNAALILVVVVVAVAAIGSRAAGAVAALSAAAWFDFFLTRPYQTFNISDSDDVETAVLLLVVGLIVSQLAARARRLEVITVTDADYLARIHETADLAQSSTSADAVVDHVRHQLTELLGLRACRFEYGTLMGQPPRLGQDGTVTVGRKRWDIDSWGWPEGEIELRTYGNGHYLGRFMLTPGPGAVPPLQARLVALALADRTGGALDTAGPVRDGNA